MTLVAEVVCAPAKVSGDRAAIHALPVDEANAVFFALMLTHTSLFKEAFLTKKIFLLGLTLLGCSHLLLAVNQASKVRLAAAMALIERAAMVGELLWFIEVNVVFCRQSIVF